MKRDQPIFEADLSSEEWEAVREVAERAINEGLFDKDPLKCVVNAYVTILMIAVADQESKDNEVLH